MRPSAANCVIYYLSYSAKESIHVIPSLALGISNDFYSSSKPIPSLVLPFRFKLYKEFNLPSVVLHCVISRTKGERNPPEPSARALPQDRTSSYLSQKSSYNARLSFQTHCFRPRHSALALKPVSSICSLRAPSCSIDARSCSPSATSCFRSRRWFLGYLSETCRLPTHVPLLFPLCYFRLQCMVCPLFIYLAFLVRLKTCCNLVHLLR